jgi:hypothetical protein
MGLMKILMKIDEFKTKTGSGHTGEKVAMKGCVSAGGGAGGMEIGNLHMADGYFSDGISMWAPSREFASSSKHTHFLPDSKSAALFHLSDL